MHNTQESIDGKELVEELLKTAERSSTGPCCWEVEGELVI